jgi:hypothetical protein
MQGFDPPHYMQAQDEAGRTSRMLTSPGNPFRAGNQAGMIAAVSDPFYEAFSAGLTEGVLVLQSTKRGVPTYGPPPSQREAAPVSDRAMLREIRMELAGSFSSFLDNMFGNAPARGAAQAANRSEPNPFAKSGEATPSSQTGAKDAASNSKQETGAAGDGKGASDTSSKQDSDSSSKAQPDSASTDGTKAADAAGKTPSGGENSTPTYLPGPFGIRSDASPLKVVRPLIMMHLNKEGNLQAFPSMRIKEDFFDAAEMGIRQFNVLHFAQPAELATALAVADLNRDGVPDVCYLDSHAGVLHFLMGQADGTYAESMQVEVGTGPRSIAAGDFNRDGRTDIAISSLGIGTLTFLYLGDAGEPPAFKSTWLDKYRDAILASDTTGTGVMDLVGLSFPNLAEVLNLGRAGGAAPGKTFPYTPALERKVATLFGYQLQLNATLLKSSLSVNLQNYQNQMVNIVNIHAGNDMFVIVGDMNNDNSISIALATLRK